MTAMVIVGGGHAAGQAAASLRQGGYDGNVIVLGDEDYLPYQRPPLSKHYLSGAEERHHLYLRSPEFYAKKNIDIRTGVTVTGIDVRQKTVTTGQGETLGYHKLLLATGSRPRRLSIPGAALQGIFYLRTIADVDRIRIAMRDAHHVCIIGGGYIGLEVAAVTIGLGKQVTVLEMEERILQRVTTAELSHFYHELHSEHGVTIKVSTTATAFAGDTYVSEVLCGDNKVSADLVIVGIGIVPNTELAEHAGLECSNGIVVNERCQTANADIYAAGDCTNHPNPVLGRRLRLESVPNAMDQAKVAAANMLGGDEIHDAVPWFWSDQYDLKLQMVGFAADGDQHIVRGSQKARQFAVFHLKDDIVVAVDAVNRPRDFMIGRKLFGQRVDVAALADDDIELKAMLE